MWLSRNVFKKNIDNVSTELFTHWSFHSNWPSVKFGSAVSPSSAPELSGVMEPAKKYLLSRRVENNYFTDPSSITECVELLDGSAGSALHSGYDVRTCIDFCNKGRDFE